MTKRLIKPPATSSAALTADFLLEGERVTFEADSTAPKASDEELNSRYVKGDIRIVTEQARYPLAGILQMLQETKADESGKSMPRYMLDPEYQRRHRWSDQRKSRLIESFLLNVPVPPVFLYERDLARFEVMDGRQRLTALSDFYSDKFALIGMEYWPDLDGRRYSTLPSKVRDGIDRRYISSIILLQETANTEAQAAILKKLVFERLNSGGVKLGSQETRNAIYSGPLNTLCLELSENQAFRRLWGIPLDANANGDNRDEDNEEVLDEATVTGIRMFEKMEDVELVLRFFAYRQLREFRAGLNKISEFLDLFLVRGNRFSLAVLTEYRAMFESTINFLSESLGADAFTLLDSGRRRAIKIVYDPLMYIASSAQVLPHRAALVSNKGLLREELLKIYAANADLFSGRRTNFVDSQQRNTLVREAFVAAISRVPKN
nr:DUF262 domain-containing protein [uncultured Albidiferax sp.]